MPTSIRFFYKDAGTINEYKIDKTRIYVGGISAGSYTPLHVAHFDELVDVPKEIDSLYQSMGGFEGNCGNPGYSYNNAGVIELRAALTDSTWIKLNLSGFFFPTV